MDSTPAPPADYVPAPHLVAGSFINAADLAFYYRDFYESLKYIHCAPELVFERLVANLNASTEIALARPYNSNHTAELARLRSAVSEIVTALDKYGDGKDTIEVLSEKLNSELRSFIDVLKAELAGVTTAFSLKAEQVIRETDDEKKDLRSLVERLNSELAEVKSALETQVEATTRERDSKQELQLSNDKLGEELAEVNMAHSREVENYAAEKGLLQSSNEKLQSSLDLLNSDFEEVQSEFETLAEAITRERGSKDELQLSNDKLRETLAEANLAHSREAGNYTAEKEPLQSSNEKLQSTISSLETDLVGAQLSLLFQKEAAERRSRDKEELQSSLDRLSSELTGVKSTLSLQVALTNQESLEKKELESELGRYKALVAELRSKVPVLPAIGTFHTSELGWWSHPLETWKKVAFSKQHPAPLDLALGYLSLHISSGPLIYVCPTAHSFKDDSCNITISMYRKTILHSAGCTWLEVGPADLDFQCGGSYANSSSGQRINFPRPYDKPPKVVVWLSQISGNFPNPVYLCSYVTDITATGFMIHIDGSQNESPPRHMSWYSHTADKAGVYSGSIETSYFSHIGYVSFPSGVFTTAPRIAIAMNGFQISASHKVNVSVNTFNITAAGMSWSFGGALDGSPNRASASFIALE